jgi:serine/threonine protein kinase
MTGKILTTTDGKTHGSRVGLFTSFRSAYFHCGAIEVRITVSHSVPSFQCGHWPALVNVVCCSEISIVAHPRFCNDCFQIDLPEIEYEDLCIEDEAVIGSGASKVVYRGMYVGTTPDVSLASGTFVALHKYHCEKPPAAVELRAICRASAGASKYLAQFYAYCWSPSNKVCLMQELAKHGSVQTLCSYCDDHKLEISTSHKLAIARDVLLGVEALHNMNIVHGDIAARNVLIFEFDPLNADSLQAKLTDFGLARNSSSYYDTGNVIGATLDPAAPSSQVTVAASVVLDLEGGGASWRGACSGETVSNSNMGADPHVAALPTGYLASRPDHRPLPQPSLPESSAAVPIFWAAPETLSRNKCHEGSDIWAYGVFLWELFTECQRRPWWDLEVEDRASMLTELERGERLPSKVDGCSVPDPVYDLLLHCWGLRRKDRPGVRQLKVRLDALNAAEAESLQRAWMSPGLAWYYSGITPLEELEAELQEQDAFQPLSNAPKLGSVTKDGGPRQRSFWGTVQEIILGRGRAGAMARGLTLERIDLIKNADALCSFKAHLRLTVNERRARGVHPEEIRLSEEQQQRLLAMDMWSCETDMMEAGLQHGCRVVLAWHGCSVDAADAICQTRLSMREFSSRDSGYFGRGVYLTPEAEYAEKYATPGEDGKSVLLLCAVLCDRVYPVTDVDYDRIDGVRAPASCFAGFKPLQPGFDTHLVAIRCDRKYQAAAAGEIADYHEIVVGQEAQVLPLARVEVRLH